MRIIACLACSLDGKIAMNADPLGKGLGTRADMNRLKAVRAMADAVLVGAETFRAYPKLRKDTQGRAIPATYILSRSLALPADAPAFEATGHALTIVSPEMAPAAVQTRFPPHLRWQRATSVEEILALARADGVETLLVEGGGQIVHWFLKARALQTLYLTICPLLIGGDAPGLITGHGFGWTDVPRTRLLRQETVDQELFLDLAIDYPPPAVTEHTP